jgi:hypothetical protein
MGTIRAAQIDLDQMPAKIYRAQEAPGRTMRARVPWDGLAAADLIGIKAPKPGSP